MVLNTRYDDLFFEYRVGFFHRTVRDYLQDKLRQNQIRARLPGCNILEDYGRLHLAEFKFARTKAFYLACDVGTHNPFKAIFDSSFELFKFLRDRGEKVPVRILEEFDKVLNSHRHSPFSHPDETEENTGYITWGESSNMDWTMGVDMDISYLHWAAAHGQHEYVSKKVSESRDLLTATSDLNLLLSAAYGQDPDLVRFLLKSGASSNEKVYIESQYRRKASVWMVFLALLAYTFLEGREISGLASVLEQFLEFGADGDVVFLVYVYSLRSGDCRNTELICIALQHLVNLAQPPNCVSILNLLSKRGTSRPGRRAARIISKLVPGPASRATSKYRSLAGIEIFYVDGHRGRGPFLRSVCTKTSQLPWGFEVRLY
jgi:hypothetical protein